MHQDEQPHWCAKPKEGYIVDTGTQAWNQQQQPSSLCLYALALLFLSMKNP